MFGNQSHAHHGQCSGGTGNHARPASEQGCDKPDDEGSVKPHQRGHSCHKGKGDSLRNQGQGDSQTGQNIVLGTETKSVLAINQIKHEWLAENRQMK